MSVGSTETRSFEDVLVDGSGEFHIDDVEGGRGAGVWESSGNRRIVFRSSFTGMALSIAESRAFFLALYLSAPRNIDALFQRE